MDVEVTTWAKLAPDSPIISDHVHHRSCIIHDNDCRDASSKIVKLVVVIDQRFASEVQPYGLATGFDTTGFGCIRFFICIFFIQTLSVTLLTTYNHSLDLSKLSKTHHESSLS